MRRFCFQLGAGESRTVDLDGHAYAVGFDGELVSLDAEKPYQGPIRQDVTLYRDGVAIQFDRVGDRVAVRIFPVEGTLRRGTDEWKAVAYAFHAAAHGDWRAFDQLPAHLLATDEAEACRAFRASGASEDVDTAGRLLTGGSRSWHAYLGRG